MVRPSLFSRVVFRRTYSRPKDDGTFENFYDMVCRVISHQRWLWERILDRKLNDRESSELATLQKLMLERKVIFGGRILWLGGTELVKKKEIAMFNCTYVTARTVNDIVDIFWCLLNGAGVGFRPESGVLNGFQKRIPKLEIIRSERMDKGGREYNTETWDPSTGTWTISVGDSGEAWAKSIGKLLAGKYPASKLVLDFSQIRPAGTRLSGYGWVCSGDAVIAEEYEKVFNILNRRAGRILTHMDILDIINHLGVIQTGRRGAEIALFPYGKSGWVQFANAKKDFWKTGNNQRAQSNNSLLFESKPGKRDLKKILSMMVDAGGSEPGIINYSELKRRAPFAEGVNPCAEILLPDKGTCNLCEINVAAFDDLDELVRASEIIARANYRQTLVNLDDGILQDAWDENNQFLRLCGVSLTGMTMRPDLTAHDLKMIRNAAVTGACSMSYDLGTPVPKNITTVKPSGTVAKVLDVSSGIHKPLGKYMFFNVVFSKHDDLVNILKDSGYDVIDHPSSSDSVVVKFPFAYDNVEFDRVGGIECDCERAVSQLNRYREAMRYYCDQNVSVTVYYRPDEIDEIANWLHTNWDDYVGVSFLPRIDPLTRPEDVGYQYLPQQVVSREEYEQYVGKVKDISDEQLFRPTCNDDLEIDVENCAGGVCPVR